MDGQFGARDLGRVKWIGVILPVTFVWLFELVRLFFLEPAYDGETAHVVAALLMAAAVVAFALGMSSFLERAQRQIVGQNRDLTLTHAVSSAARTRVALPETLAETLEQVVTRTGALAGIVVVDGVDGDALDVRRPVLRGPGLGWVETLLDEDVSPPPPEPAWTERRAVDTGLLDLPLARGGIRFGRVRLVFHPAVRPEVSGAALADIAGEIATAVELARLVGDLRRREHERAALYEVALQLTGRADLRETLDMITRHAKELLASDRSIICLADGPGLDPQPARRVDRLALIEDGSTRTISHIGGPGRRALKPDCQMLLEMPDAAFASCSLGSPEGELGEMCVVRQAGPPFSPAERSLLGALAGMAAIAVRTARLRDAEQQFTILSERDRIARELHDSLAQVLGVIHLRLRALEPAVADGGRGARLDPHVGRELADLAETADEAYRDVREAILGLRETISTETGLEGTLRDYLAKYGRQTAIRASLVCEGDLRHVLPPRSEVQLLRVVQEALTNVRKHARATSIVVRLDCRSAIPQISIEDDGVGFDPAAVSASLDGGFGLTSMRERVEHIGGRLTVHTAPGQGTRILITLQAEEPVVTTTATAHPAGR